MALEHEKAAKVVTRKTITENAIKSVKEGATVAYVGEDGIGREALVKSISGDTADLEVILPDGQLKLFTGVKYLKESEEEEDTEAAPTAEAAAKIRNLKGGRRGKRGRRARATEDGEDAKDEPKIPRDIAKMRDTAILYEDQGGPYWHV